MDSLKPLSHTACMLGLFGIFTLGACSKPTQADCEKMADHAVDIMAKKLTEGMDESMADAVRKEAAKERDPLVEKCMADSKTYVDCVLAAQTMDEIDGC
jgi:hypothetical protein